MDPLSQMIGSLQLRGFVHTRNVFTAPWGFRLDWPPPSPLPRSAAHAPTEMPPPPSLLSASFYLLTHGTCVIEIDHVGQRIELAKGDLILFPNDSGHQMRDCFESPLRPLHEIVTPQTFKERGNVKAGGGGEATQFICGAFFLREVEDEHLVRLIRPYVHVRRGQGRADRWLGRVVSVLKHEVETFEPGAQAVIDHLAHALFIHAIREKIRQSPETEAGSIFRAGGNPQITEAMELIQNQPQEPWTIDSLARRVRMSRSSFAAKFNAMVGEPPAKYLTRVRMSRALAMLGETKLAVKQVAEKLGYQAETAFSTAFKRWHGFSPTESRRTHLHGISSSERVPG